MNGLQPPINTIFFTSKIEKVREKLNKRELMPSKIGGEHES